jgi:hypothetical protein
MGMRVTVRKERPHPERSSGSPSTGVVCGVGAGILGAEHDGQRLTRAIGTGQRPCPLPRGGPRGADGCQRGRRVGGQPADQPGDDWVGPYPAEQARLGARRAGIGQAVAARDPQR